MFSANENIALRQHKRRVISYVESTIPESALDLGTMVMAMEVSCKSPGCVPLETAVAIVFPKGQKDELIPGLSESGAEGGTFKTKILMPMAEVTEDDVLDALPPQFKGGRRTMETLCLRARDVMLGQIGQIIGEDDLDGKRLMVEYLMGCLRDYAERDCMAPEVSEPFPPLPPREEGEGRGDKNDTAVQRGIKGTGNFVVRRVLDDDGGVAKQGTSTPATASVPVGSSEGSSPPSSTTKPQSARNTVVRRAADDVLDDAANKGQPATSAASARAKPTALLSAQTAVGSTGSSASAASESATDWRRRQNIDAELNALRSGSSSQIIQRLSEREHAPGVRRPGCPCCDPENPANVVESMMML